MREGRAVRRLMIENLCSGMIVKNYPTMCELLGDRPTTNGVARRRQEERWAELFSWIKEGHNYVIRAVFVNPATESQILPTIIGERDYIKLLAYNILLHLQEGFLGSDSPFCYRYNELARIVGLVNQDYPPTKEKLKKAKITAGAENTNYFKGDVFNSNKRELTAAFRHIQKNLRAVSLGMGWLVATPDQPEVLLEGQDSVKVLSCYTATLSEFGLSGMQQVHCSHKAKEFWKSLAQKLYERHKILRHEEVMVIYTHRIALEHATKMLEGEVPYLRGYEVLSNQFAVHRAEIRAMNVAERRAIQDEVMAVGKLLTTHLVDIPDDFLETQAILRRRFLELPDMI